MTLQLLILAAVWAAVFLAVSLRWLTIGRAVRGWAGGRLRARRRRLGRAEWRRSALSRRVLG